MFWSIKLSHVTSHGVLSKISPCHESLCKFVWLYGNSLVKFKFGQRLTKIPKFLWGLDYGYHVTVIWKSGSLRTFQTHCSSQSSICQVAVMLMYYKYCSKMCFIGYINYITTICTWVWGLKMHWLEVKGGISRGIRHCIPSLLSSYSLLSLFPHSSAFHTFDQKKRLENEPERKGPGRSMLSRKGGRRGARGRAR